MTPDLRTDAERRYDAERDGSLYTRQQPGDLVGATLEYVADDDVILDWILRETDLRVMVEPQPEACAPCVDYRCGHVTLEVLDDPAEETPGVGDGSGITVYNFGGDCLSLADVTRNLAALYTLLRDTRVKAVLAARGVALDADEDAALDDADDWVDPDDARCVRVDESRPIRVERWESPESTWLDFGVADRVRCGVYLHGTGKPGVEVNIGEHGLNERANQIITLADLRQLHADLGALLSDDRFLGALAEQGGHPPA
jgi:hypothetical protein